MKILRLTLALLLILPEMRRLQAIDSFTSGPMTAFDSQALSSVSIVNGHSSYWERTPIFPGALLSGYAKKHILVATLGSLGDVIPYLGIAVEFSRRGYLVTVLTNEHFKKLVEDSGVAFAMLGTEDE